MRRKDNQTNRFIANDPHESFAEKYLINPDNGCWEWQGLNSYRYGTFCSRPMGWETISAHRASWLLHRGPIENGLFVLHKCDNKKCVNPDHLFLGTQKDNIADRDRKGRRVQGINPNPRRGEANNKAVLVEREVIQMRALRAADGLPYYALGALYGISTQSAFRICKRQTWAHVP